MKNTIKWVYFFKKIYKNIIKNPTFILGNIKSPTLLNKIILLKLNALEFVVRVCTLEGAESRSKYSPKDPEFFFVKSSHSI